MLAYSLSSKPTSLHFFSIALRAALGLGGAVFVALLVTILGGLAHEPQDPLKSVAASWHSYPAQTCSDMACWTSVIAAVAAQVPIITGEVGDSVCNAPTYVPTLLPWANAQGLSYLGWTWNTWSDCDNVLITDYTGTPTANYGQAFQALLATTTP